MSKPTFEQMPEEAKIELWVNVKNTLEAMYNIMEVLFKHAGG